MHCAPDVHKTLPIRLCFCVKVRPPPLIHNNGLWLPLLGSTINRASLKPERRSLCAALDVLSCMKTPACSWYKQALSRKTLRGGKLCLRILRAMEELSSCSSTVLKCNFELLSTICHFALLQREMVCFSLHYMVQTPYRLFLSNWDFLLKNNEKLIKYAVQGEGNTFKIWSLIWVTAQIILVFHKKTEKEGNKNVSLT